MRSNLFNVNNYRVNSSSDFACGSDLNISDLMILLNSGMDSADLDAMITKAQKKYVDAVHKQAISFLQNASGYKKGKWKTYYYEEPKKRKELIRKTEDEIYAFLYDFYHRKQEKTLQESFEMLYTFKKVELDRSDSTLKGDERMFGYLSDNLKNKYLKEITDEDILFWINKEFIPKHHPTKEALKKQFELINQIFEYAIKKRYCLDNPLLYLDVREFYKNCNIAQKSDEEKAFSQEDCLMIKKDMLKDSNNPRALMALMAIETGMRAGELSALHISDIANGFIHVHRQQIRGIDEQKHQYFYEVPYTKDERIHPHDGRYIPITEECEDVIQRALHLPGKSEYLFHNKDGNMISTDSYSQYLRVHCRRLGLSITNNHAFRMAFNAKLIDKEFTVSERALILGHSVATNEKNYSLTDKRKLKDLKDKLCGKPKKEA